MDIKKQSFLKGAAVLAVAGIVSKILGAIYRIPLGQLITSEGMGYYQTAYQLYILLLSFSSSVIPIAISKLVSEKIGMGRRYEAHKIFRVSFILLVSLGAFFSVSLFIGAQPLAHYLKNDSAYLSILSVAPALFTVSLSAAYRGYFQGMQNMTPSAVSQINEQFARVTVGFALVFILLPQGYQAASAGAIFGTTIGGLASFLTLYYIYRKKRSEIKPDRSEAKGITVESTASIIKRIIVFSVPITIGGSIMPLMGLLDLGIVMNRLQMAGFTAKMANSLYGQLSGMAMSFINLPQVFTIALSASLVPTISESMARHDYLSVRKKSELGIRVALLIGLPAALGLFVLAQPIMTLIYPREPQSLSVIMSYLAPSVIFLTLVQTTTGILQGMGKERVPVTNILVGALVKVIISYTLTAIPSINIIGAAISTVAGYAVSAGLNLNAILRYQKSRLNMTKIVIRPAIATALMTATAYFSYKAVFTAMGSNAIASLISMSLAAVVYAITLILIKGVTKEELEMAPGGKKLFAILRKKGML